MGRKTVSRLLPVFGILFVTAYIRSASVNVVYTDYIRLINSYLENVFSLSPYLHADILTRIPANYIERMINVVFFHYSTMFDMMLGAFALGISAFVTASYCAKRKIGLGQTCIVLFVMFSLNKWEMLTNGSGWIHFAAFALFFYHYLVYDRVMAQEEKKGDRKKLLILPWVIILLFAGPYCAVYASVLILSDLFLLWKGREKKSSAAKREEGKQDAGKQDAGKQDRKEALQRIFCMLVPLILYMISRAFSVEDISGATTESILTVISKDPAFLPLLFIRSFSSMLIGVETTAALDIPKSVTVVLGLFVIFCYGYALWLNLKEKLYEKSVFPLILLVSGFFNHLLILSSRWIFLDDSYGMSSRYALQFEVGILGILLTIGLSDSIRKERKKTDSGRRSAGMAAVLISLAFLAGNLVTTSHEIGMAPYRQERFIEMRDAAVKFETLSDEELAKTFQYHDGEKTRKALTILRDRRLNVYR